MLGDEGGQHPLFIGHAVARPQRAGDMLVEVGEEVEAGPLVMIGAWKHAMLRHHRIGGRDIVLNGHGRSSFR
jgi:hypothetical protein